MRSFSELVFDRMVYGTDPVFTDASWNSGLGLPDQLAIFAKITQVSGTSPTITVAIENSGDNILFGEKSGTPQINNQTLAANLENIFMGSDSGASPSLAFVRLAVTLGGTTPAAWVRLYVTGRSGT
jgi:hypothetical protein